MTDILVVAEVRAGKLKRPSLEAVSVGKQLAATTGGKVLAIAIGAGLDAAGAELAAAGAHALLADAPQLQQFSGDAWAKIVADQAKQHAPAAVLMPHTAMGKDLLPRVAALLDTGLVTDAIAVAHEGGAFTATKPVFAGKALLKVRATRQPFMATLRPNNFPVAEGGGGSVTKVQVAPPADLLSVVREVVAASSDRVPLQEAKVIVSGGRGLKGPEHFHLIEDLAAAFGPGVAAVGSSRAVVDAGWRPHREQVGQTGKVVSPQLYIAVGISGAIQHLAGMRTARTIVAINKDADAPIFKVADYGIVGDAFEIVPALAAAVRSAVASSH